MDNKKIAVRELAYFMCQSGSLTKEFFSNSDMLRGQRAHDYLQDKYNEESKKEVYIKQDINYLGSNYILHGFIDGLLNINNELILEEIKSTTKELDEIDIDYHKEHMAQLKIYGYLYALQNNLDVIHLRLTYISVVDYETKSFDSYEKIEDLEEFSLNTLEEYIKFINLLDEAKENKNKSIDEIKFPFKEMRQGQKDLMKACYKAANDNEILYVIAPTGIGKTIATMFSTLKALKPNEKLFYLTAKGSGKNAPMNAIKLLSKDGLKIKSIDITAKQKICNLKSKNCNPEECPFAKGYFDRLRIATMDAIKNYDIYDRKVLTEISNKHNICAFEFSLYLSYYCDIVIADFNYIFDPVARLTTYDDDSYNIRVLVDEAHNLISRSKEMYSALIEEEDIKGIRRALTGLKPSIRSDCNQALEIINKYRDNITDGAIYVDPKPNLELDVSIRRIINKIDDILEKNKKLKNKDEVMDYYLKLLAFNSTSEIFSDAHRHLAKIENDNVIIEYFCLDASSFLLETIKKYVKSIVFFSATLYPIEYHANLLTKGEGKYLELKSPFNPNNLDLIINNSISTKYKDRAQSIDSIVEAIEILTKTKKGNHIVFFPSYQYLQMVLDSLDDIDSEIIVQKSNLTDDEKDEIINKFNDFSTNKLGLFVMGGAFSEGIDLIGDSLSGVIIVGVGLPMICDENNILKDYFEEMYNEGFDYAYTYPGFTKVIQAVGRLIRTETDKGVAILIDTRFTYSKYLNLMPPHWNNKKIINNSYQLKKELEDFYNKN